MILSRRKALFGLLAAPAIIKTPGLLMPIKPEMKLKRIVTVTVKISGMVPSSYNVECEAYLIAEKARQYENYIQQQIEYELTNGKPIQYNTDGFKLIKDAAQKAIDSGVELANPHRLFFS